MHEVAVLALPNVLDSALALLLEVFAAANRIRAASGKDAAFATRVYGTRTRTVPTGLGFSFRAHARLSELAGTPSILVLPGENEVDGAALVARVRAPGSAPLLRILERELRRGALVAASC